MAGESTRQPRPLNSFREVARQFLLPRAKLLAIGFLLIVVSRLCALILPYSTKFLIDDVILAPRMPLGGLLMLVAAGVVINAGSSFLLTQLLSIEAQRVIADLRKRIQRHVLRLPVGFFDQNKTGALVSRIMEDVDGVRNLVGTGVVHFVGGAVQAIVALVLLLRIHAVLTSVVIVPLILFGLVSMRAFAMIRPIFRKRREIHADVTGRLTESLGGIRVVKGFHAEEQEAQAFGSGVDRLFENIKRSLTATSLVTSSSVLLLGLAGVAAMGYGAGLIRDGSITVGQFFSFVLMLGFMITPILQMANIATQITEAFAGLDRTQELLSHSREIDDPKRTRTLEQFNGTVALENVSFAYESSKLVLHDISFRAEAGTITALVGSSGSGKTTIAGLVASYLAPSSGRVLADGIDLSTVTLDSFRSHLGVVLQDDFLFEGTIRENIRYARPDAGEEEIRRAVESAYIDEFSDRFEKGLETVIGERGVKLSGGQRQRVAIARALLADPRLLILDEATSSLDAESERYIQSSLAKLMAGRTTLVIAHRLSTIKRADQILVIEKGRIVERGTHESLLETKGRYYELYTYQVRI